MGTDRPFWVPGEAEREARERLEAGVTGLYGGLPPGLGPLLEVAATMTARAFAAFARGDQEACDASLAEGLAATGGIFAGLVERITSPAWLSRVDSPAWVPFVAHAASMVLDPPPEPAPGPQAPAPRPAPVDLADELRAMGLM